MRGTLALGAAALLAVAACGDGPSRSGPDDGALFAMGPGSDWRLMSVPREGGPARLADLRGSGEDGVRAGTAELPRSGQAHRLGDGYLALLTPDGRALRYDPVGDLTSEAGRIPAGAEWTSHGQWGVFRDTATGDLLQLAPGGTWTYRPSPPPTWASPVGDGSVVAVLPADGDGSGALVRYERGGTEAVARLEGDFAPEAAVTGFGEQVALARRDGEGWELVLVSVSELEPLGRTPLPAAPDALVASPSDHELYVAVGDRLLVMGRPSLSLRLERPLPGRAVDLRPGLLGGPLLLRTADGAVHVLPWDREESVPVESRWRPDLPLSLPDGSVLAVRPEGMVRIGPDGQEATPPAPADRWWIAVRADGLSPREPAAGADAAAADPTPPEGPAGEGPEAPEEAAAGSVEDSVAALEDAGPEAGFYAVVGATRSRDGIEGRLSELAADGWPTAVQEWRDDAGQLWYRGLVGPYMTRPEAEEAGRELQRELDLATWVKELGPGISGQP